MHLDAVEIDPVQRRGGAARVDKLNLSRLAIGHGFVTLRTDVRVALKAPPGGEGWVPRDKPLWFGPSTQRSGTLSADELRERLPLEHSLLFSRIDNQTEQLFFIVPSHWNR